MKGKIDKGGSLCIYRGKRHGYVTQECRPYGRVTGQTFSYCSCNHNCSMFGEPYNAHVKLGKASIGLALCKRTLYFDELIDEREKAEG